MMLYDLFDVQVNKIIMQDMTAKEIAEQINYPQTWVPSRVGKLLKERWIIEFSQSEIARHCNQITSTSDDPAWVRDFVVDWVAIQKLFGIAGR